ncbi:EamA family transporter [Hyphomicrobium sp. 1Nfss2.1]|uniref:EamA family transporter n=1 Tax=Hyphomicrobium sp. 1Nfss2.1 TaxID=3413936 RepID=UPI003C7EC7A8
MALLVGIAAVARSAALSGVDPLQIMFFRNFFCVVLMLPLLWRRGASLVRTKQPKLYAFRVAVSFVAMLSYFEALALLPMAEVTAIGFLAPLFGALVRDFPSRRIRRPRPLASAVRRVRRCHDHAAAERRGLRSRPNRSAGMGPIDGPDRSAHQAADGIG